LWIKRKNDFAERFKNFVKSLKIIINAAKNFDILATIGTKVCSVFLA